MSDLDQQLAEALDAAALPPELVWESAPTCPSGHPVNLPWQLEPEKGFQIGELCPDCLFMVHHFTTRDRDAHEDDLAWHPEWRIGRVPKPLSTDATTLLAAVEAWRKQDEDERDWRWYSAWKDQPAIGQVMTSEDECVTVEAPYYAEALARALLAALTAKGAER